MIFIKHPLINESASHYRVNGKETILEIEKELTICELIGAAKFNIKKYALREKGQDVQDMTKIEDYTRYLNFLRGLLTTDFELYQITVLSEVMRIKNMKWSTRK